MFRCNFALSIFLIYARSFFVIPIVQTHKKQKTTMTNVLNANFVKSTACDTGKKRTKHVLRENTAKVRRTHFRMNILIGNENFLLAFHNKAMMTKNLKTMFSTNTPSGSRPARKSKYEAIKLAK